MKNKKQIQEENRKAIIIANNLKAKDCDEVLEMEEEQVIQSSSFTSGTATIKEYIVPNNFIAGLGKPLTLSRVLIALRDKHLIVSTAGYICKKIGDDECQNICYWDLTKETLEEQTEKTQRQINKLLIK